MGDTNRSTTWKEFLQIIKEYGFEIVSRRAFEYPPYGSSGRPQTCADVIAAHREKKLLLHATSYTSQGCELVSGGDVYGTVHKGDASPELYSHVFFGCRCSAYAEDLTDFAKGVSVGLIGTLKRIEKHFQFVDWHNPDRFLWLLDGVERNSGDPDLWEKRRDEFLSSAPDWVKSFII